ncbi:universal stress protein [Umezawaea endophytica]|uniref:Universal stress protein n=1 Tax=Umezawaea endophytica TaxID=1654476 RepID=A0A9X2VXY1_9PSEU|nr:universal stress protein [Umezawaea endophytica]MCS7484745.1 universal stress protein [Umezawaea endophytica]
MEHRKVIVVGVDGSPASTAALRWALAQGPSTVEAVMASARVGGFVPAVSLGIHPYAHQPEADHRHPEQRLHDAVTEAVTDMPDAPEVAEIVVVGDAGAALVQASLRADLLVIGAKGRDPMVDVFPGGVASHCVRHAACPVVVIPPALVG